MTSGTPWPIPGLFAGNHTNAQALARTFDGEHHHLITHIESSGTGRGGGFPPHVPL